METTHKNEAIYSNINGQFVALVENGIIYQVNSFTGQRIQVGVVQQTFDELKTITDGYYQKLIDAGIIKEPKAPEQIIEEQQVMMAQQQAMMAQMLEAINKLNQKVEVLENGRAGTNNETV